VGDGAMGTILQDKGLLPAGHCPDLLNLSAPDAVQEVHEQYLAAGANLIQTNTFGANRVKLAAYGAAELVREINQRGADLARRAAKSACLVAGNIGPTGQLLEPFGPLSLAAAADIFYEQAQALVAAGADLFLIETMSDLHEAKAAVMGARAASSKLPIICSVTYTEDLRTLTGADPETVITVLEALGVDVVGSNCGFGPDLMAEILARQWAISDLPLLAQPNAGLPRWQDGRTVYSLGPEEFAAYASELVAAGANIIGGCCGTTPAHIRLLAEQAQRLNPKPRSQPRFSKLAGASQTVYIGEKLPTPVVGERINPTGRRRLAKSLRERKFHLVAEEAQAQVKAGAALIDVNVGVRAPGLAEAELLPQAVLAVQRAVAVPVVIDTSDLQAMEAALQVCRGKPLLNSTTGQPQVLEKVTDLASKYGAAILGLTLDDTGIPAKAKERLAIARRIVEQALAKGLRRQDIYIDALTLTVGASQEQLVETLRAVYLIKEELGVRTTLGVSNVSHGMPQRATLNNTFLAMALGAGLDLPIINPDQLGLWEVIRAADVLTNRDPQAKLFLATATEGTQLNTPAPQPARIDDEQQLQREILAGETSRLADLTQSLLQAGWPALEIVNSCIIPAMEVAGNKFEQKEFFLPQLLLAAEAAQKTFRILHPELKRQATNSSLAGTVILATVQGDIHDIGKSIVGLLLENHGFRVVDLGKNVPNEQVVDAAIAEQADLIALSALMTTTMPEMAAVAELMRAKGLSIPLLIGGAVVTDEFAASIGAHYAPDATSAVRVAKSLVKGGKS